MYSAHDEGKPVVAERFLSTMGNRIFKHMTSTSKNVYINKLDGINTTIHIIEQLKWSVLMQIQACILTLIDKTIRKVLSWQSCTNIKI